MTANNGIGGDGSNLDNLDITNVQYSTVKDGTGNPTALRVTMTVADLEPPPGPADNVPGALWTVYWDYQGTTWFA